MRMEQLMHATSCHEIAEISFGDLLPEMNAKDGEEFAYVPYFAQAEHDRLVLYRFKLAQRLWYEKG